MKFLFGRTTKYLSLFLLLPFILVACVPEGDEGISTTENTSEMAAVEGDFKSPLGVQLWSFRDVAQKDPLGAFDMVKEMGFSHVETAGLYNLTADSFAQAVERAGLEITSMHVSHADMRDNIETVIANAQAIGVQYVGIAWYDHEEGNFDEATARQAIADFNSWGKTLKDAGLTFFYHNHGYEPAPYGDGTLLDLIIDETDPELVVFEMDVLWTWLPNIDPIEVIERHPGRFKLMHIKDMQPGIERGTLEGRLPNEQKL